MLASSGRRSLATADGAQAPGGWGRVVGAFDVKRCADDASSESPDGGWIAVLLQMGDGSLRTWLKEPTDTLPIERGA